MRFARFFVDRPVFAGVLSIVIFIVGALAAWRLPVSQYPDVVPPQVVVRAQYPGGNPKVVAETVAAPLEQEINGVENMLYMSSQATPDGSLQLNVTFKVGTDIDAAQVQVQNRISQALPRLPEPVRRLGVTVLKSAPDLLMVVHLVSPDGRYDSVYLRNYAVLQVRDVLRRLPGMGEVRLIGSGDYAMRVWLDPQKVAARGLTAGDVVRAIREQNVEVAAGVLGGQPAPKDVDFQLTVNTSGRLVTEQEFGDIIVKSGQAGDVTRLRDVARIELGIGSYSVRSLLDNGSAASLPVALAPGANALELADDVRRTMDELSLNFPEGLEYDIIYDTTVFVRESIKAVIETLLVAVLLVVLVVVLFLQTWRASIIPLLAVPVSIVGTFALMLAFGFSINALSLFGLVLSIGIVVDDAIVVVENVQRNIEHGLSPRDATIRAMDEVSGPIIAIALVLCAVFVPIAFIGGLTGKFFQQFALTIAISTVISAFNSLTLSPALCATLLPPRGAEPDAVTRATNRMFGGLFHAFDRLFGSGSDGYGRGVRRVLRRRGLALLVYGGLVVLGFVVFRAVPPGFIPTQDKSYVIAFAQLPDAASLERTEAVMRRMGEIALAHPGVEGVVQFPGMSIRNFSTAANSAVMFIQFKPFEARRSAKLSMRGIIGDLGREFAKIPEATTGVFPPPVVSGISTFDGFALQLEDRAALGYDELYRTLQAVLQQARSDPRLAGVFSNYTVTVPQVQVDVDRVRAKQQGVALTDVFETMQVYLGSLYVNDFNRFGRTYQVIAQADAPFRARPEDIRLLQTRNAAGEMVPLASLVTVGETHGPDRVFRYNGYLSADVNGLPAPGYSSGEAVRAIRGILESLPNGVKYEWTDLTYQEVVAGSASALVFPLCVLFAFLVLAALYESWTMPLAIVLIVPMCLLFAMAGVLVSGGDNNVFTQVALVVLVGLACKNAILIVEFAKMKQDGGLSPAEAAIEAARLRLRPILMTSVAFIMGVLPLAISTGAGAEMRRAIGIAVFSGMLGVTIFGLFLTPLFYVLVQGAAASLRRGRGRAGTPPAPAGGPEDGGG